MVVIMNYIKQIEFNVSLMKVLFV